MCWGTRKTRRIVAALACGLIGASGFYLCSPASRRTVAWSSGGAGIMLRNGWLIVIIGDGATYGREVAQLEALHSPTRWMGKSATWYRTKGLWSLADAIAANGQWAGARRAPHIVYLWAHGWAVVSAMLSAGLLAALATRRRVRS